MKLVKTEFSVSDMQRFCAKEKTNFRLGEPFRIDGYLYATNGHILIRVKSEGTNTVRAGIPDVRGLVKPRPVGAMKAVGKIEGTASCSQCDGLGMIGPAGECDECHGRGDELCGCCDNYTVCKKCDGSGKLDGAEKCGRCNGTGDIQVEHVDIGVEDGAIRHDVFDLLNSLPGLRIQKKIKDKSQYVYFSFDGGDGVFVQMLIDDRRPQKKGTKK